LDDASTEEALEKLVTGNFNILVTQEKVICELLSHNRDENNQAAAQELAKMKFMIKLANEIETKLDRITDS
jgi:molecular chaperone HscB